jgi:hypothetical protein
MSRSSKPRWTLALLAVTLLLVGGCTNDSLDNGSSADVVLEVEMLENPPVNAALDQTTGVCTFTVEDWRFSAFNLPKNTVTEDSSPYNDISMISVTVGYLWVNGALATPTRTFGLGGVAIPVGETAEVTFQPIALDDLSIAYAGSTANLDLTFHARTTEGTDIITRVARALTINSCQ